MKSEGIKCKGLFQERTPYTIIWKEKEEPCNVWEICIDPTLLGWNVETGDPDIILAIWTFSSKGILDVARHSPLVKAFSSQRVEAAGIYRRMQLSSSYTRVGGKRSVSGTDRPSQYKSRPARLLFSSYKRWAGREPCWASPLASGLLD